MATARQRGHPPPITRRDNCRQTVIEPLLTEAVHRATLGPRPPVRRRHL